MRILELINKFTFRSHVLKWAGLVAVRNKQTQIFASYVNIQAAGTDR